MKSSVMPAVVLIIVLGGSAMGALVAHYHFDGNAQDSSGNNLHGTPHGGPGYAPGVIGQAINLDGINDYVDCGNNSKFNITSGITVAMWVNLATLPGDWRTVVSKGDTSWRVSNYGVEKRCHFSIEGPPDYTSVQSGAFLVEGEWYHVCATFDGSALRMYVDGQLERQTLFSGSMGSNSYPVLIGDNAQMQGRFWHGLIDDLRIYNHALSASEITALVTVSQRVVVPDVVGMSQSAASSSITSAGLVVGRIGHEHGDTIPRGSVISQNPAAGASVAAGSSVALTVSLGPEEVPLDPPSNHLPGASVER